MLVKYSELLGKVKQQQTWVLLYNSFQNTCSNENMLINYIWRMKDWIYEFSYKFTMMRCPVVQFYAYSYQFNLIETYRYFETQVHSTVVC